MELANVKQAVWPEILLERIDGAPAEEDPSSCPHIRHRMQELRFAGFELYIGSGSPEKTTHSFLSHTLALPVTAPIGSVC